MPSLSVEARCAAQMIALKRVSKGLFVDDLAAGDVDGHATRLHLSETFPVEKLACFGSPMAANYREVASR
jgi:hypothetical protein